MIILGTYWLIVVKSPKHGNTAVAAKSNRAGRDEIILLQPLAPAFAIIMIERPCC
jgi:hypothetical protein